MPLWRPQEVLGPLAREGDMSPPGDDPLDQQARNEHGAEERSDDTDDKGRGEALYGAVTEDEEHDTRHGKARPSRGAR